MRCFLYDTGASQQHVVFNALDNGHVRTFQMPISLHDNDNNGNESAGIPETPVFDRERF